LEEQQPIYEDGTKKKIEKNVTSNTNKKADNEILESPNSI